MAGAGLKLPERDAGEGILEGDDGTPYLSPLWAEAFLGLVRAGDQLARELDAELRQEHGLALHAFEVLLFLTVFAEEGRLRISELADNAPLSQSRVSRLVADLETRGLVERATAEDDARGVTVSITDEGRERFRAAQDTHLRGLQERLFDVLTDRQIRQLARITRKLLDRDENEE